MLKHSRAIILVLLVPILCLAMPIYAEWTPPADRVPLGGIWTPGIPGGIPSRATICTTLSETGDSRDRTSDINNALIGCDRDGIVYLNPGTYYVSGTIVIPSNTVLRGSGMDQTYIRKTGTGKTVISIGNGMPYSLNNYQFDEWEQILSGFGKDSSAILVSDSSGYAPDQLALIAQGDGANPDVPPNTCTWGKMNATGAWPPNDYGSIGQMNLISSVSGTTINLTSPLYYEFSDTYKVSVGRISAAVRNAGVEELTIYREQAASNSNDIGAGEIFISRAVYCWAKNVELDRMSGNGVNIAWSYGITVHGMDIQDSWWYTSGGGGYQVMVKTYSSNVLIENCIIRQGTPNIHFDVAGAGSVVAYNFVDVAVTNGGTTWAVYNVGPHCPTPFMMLFEGNVISLLENDNTHGTNAIYVMLLRNHFDAINTEWTPPLNNTMSTENRSAIDLNSNAHYWTIIGNVLGRSGDSYGAYQTTTHGTTTAYIYRQGTDILDTLIRHGNYDYYDKEVKWCAEENSEADCQGSGNDQDLPKSLYLIKKPPWWDDQGSGRPWPSIGPDIDGYVIDIPAKDRFEGETYNSSSRAPMAPEGLKVIEVNYI